MQASENDPRVTRVGPAAARDRDGRTAAALEHLPRRHELRRAARAAARRDRSRTATGASSCSRTCPGSPSAARVRPGLTGVAQIYAPRDIPRRHKFRYDRALHPPAVVLARRAAHPALVLDHFRGTWEAREEVLTADTVADASRNCPRCTTSSIIGGRARRALRRRAPGCRWVPTRSARRARGRRRARALHGRARRRGVRRVRSLAPIAAQRADHRALLVSGRASKSCYPSGRVEAVVDRSARVRSRAVRAARRRPGVAGRARRARDGSCRSTRRASPSRRRRRRCARARRACSRAARTTALHRQVGLGMPRLFLHTAQLELPAASPRRRRAAFRQRDRAEGFRLGRAGRPAHDSTCARVGVMCENDAPRYFDRLLARVGGALGHRPGGRRRPAPEDPAAGAAVADLRRPPAGRRRCRRPGEADHRRRHLLQPGQRGAGRRCRSTEALSRERSQRATARAVRAALARAAVGRVSGAAQAAPASRIG